MSRPTDLHCHPRRIAPTTKNSTAKSAKLELRLLTCNLQDSVVLKLGMILHYGAAVSRIKDVRWIFGSRPHSGIIDYADVTGISASEFAVVGANAAVDSHETHVDPRGGSVSALD